MSEYFIVVNETKREFVDPSRFGKSFKRGSVLTGLHGNAIGLMLTDSAFDEEGLVGSWCGDKIIVAGDLAPVVGEREQLYFRVKSEGYQDVSLRALAIVTTAAEAVKTLVAEAKHDRALRNDLWAITTLYQRANLAYHLENEFGPRDGASYLDDAGPVTMKNTDVDQAGRDDAGDA